MLAHIISSGFHGVEGCTVGVEVDTVPGLPVFDIVGLPDASVREARERVRSAVRNTGLAFPLRRTTVNLTPADMRKEGTGFDLPIALGMLASTGVIPDSRSGQYSAIGELSLDGGVRRVRGSVPMVSRLLKCSRFVIVPADNMPELSLLASTSLCPVSSLSEAVDLVKGGFRDRVAQASQPQSGHEAASSSPVEVDLKDVSGLEVAKRALEVAASGGHHIIIAGPPGVGKSLLARALHGLLPALSSAEAVDVLSVYSAAGLTCEASLRRPMRQPHHSISARALIGGGPWATPGEVSLAHRGVLLLDELPEFRRDCIEALRQPLEVPEFSVSRARWTYRFPCDFQMVATANLCPCGNQGRAIAPCKCSDRARSAYIGRLSGPLLDRVDMCVVVGEAGSVNMRPPRDDSAAVATRVATAHGLQRSTRGALNARVDYRRLVERETSPDALRLLEEVAVRTGMSMRSQAKTLRVARTIADMAECRLIEVIHMGEAFQHRATLS